LDVPDIELAEENSQHYPGLNSNVMPRKQQHAARPISHGSRSRLKRGLRRLAEERAPW
jgi:hypothetical protein